jgi:hypothetical protein
MQHYLKFIPHIGSMWRIIANKVLFILWMIVYWKILLKRIIMTTDDAITICEGIIIVDFKICLDKGVITVKVTVIVNLRWLVIRSYSEQRFDDLGCFLSVELWRDTCCWQVQMCFMNPPLFLQNHCSQMVHCFMFLDDIAVYWKRLNDIDTMNLLDKIYVIQ